jgi:hypothetical protein
MIHPPSGAVDLTHLIPHLHKHLSRRAEQRYELASPHCIGITLNPDSNPVCLEQGIVCQQFGHGGGHYPFDAADSRD